MIEEIIEKLEQDFKLSKDINISLERVISDLSKTLTIEHIDLDLLRRILLKKIASN